MRKIQTDVLVIGGGATGVGVLRDLAMRGFKCTLVERRDLASGTTGRFHGLLHSGCRYVVTDPLTARECFKENQILRHIMPQCLEDIGGYFVLTPEDDPNYVQKFLEGCNKSQIPVEELAIKRMLRDEPRLNPQIQQCFIVPDASADSFLATQLNVESSYQYGAQVLIYHEVINLLIEPNNVSFKKSVVGANCRDLIKDEEVIIHAHLVINASGAWSGSIVNSAGISIKMIHGKGTMLALNHRIVNTIINRCKLPADGDILVPAHTVAVIGTTDIQVNNPEHYSIEPAEIRLLLNEGEKIIPGFKDLRILRAWAGVRPLVDEGLSNNNREISRAFTLFDHAIRDGVDGLITITGGKWTTYRKMAEVCVNMACEKLKVNQPCRTHLEPLPNKPNGKSPYHYLGTRLNYIESNELYGQLICECELITKKDIESIIIQSAVFTLDDIRRKTRLGMGPCQGAFCTIKALGIWQALKHAPIIETNAILRDFLQERWKGNLPILWGQQLRQSRFTEFIYIDILNAMFLPGKHASKLASTNYSTTEISNGNPKSSSTKQQKLPAASKSNRVEDILIIGSGFTGLFAGWQASKKGYRTKLISKGWGTPYWGSGCIDIIGYQPKDNKNAITSPNEFLNDFIKENPSHPYTLSGLENLRDAIDEFLGLCTEMKNPYSGTLNRNILIPTALGTLRPTCLVPISMAAGDVSQRTPMLIVGFDGFHDFSPKLIADNLNYQGLFARDITLNLNSVSEKKIVSGITLARLFDEHSFRQEVITSLKPFLTNEGRIGFPAVIGFDHSIEALEELESSLGVHVFEIPGLPPSIPGIRLQKMMINAIERYHGSVFNGMEVSHFIHSGKFINAVLSSTASRHLEHEAKTFILATGGILGGGVAVDQSGYAKETIFNLYLNAPDNKNQWFQREFLSDFGHPIFMTTVPVNTLFQPIDAHNEVIYQNLFAIGGLSTRCDPIRERSLEGIALASSYAVIKNMTVIE